MHVRVKPILGGTVKAAGRWFRTLAGDLHRKVICLKRRLAGKHPAESRGAFEGRTDLVRHRHQVRRWLKRYSEGDSLAAEPF
jgi:hypothetical protein